MFRKKVPPHEKRQHERLYARNLVKVRKTGSSDEERLTNIFDLSMGGMRFIWHERLEHGTGLEIQLSIPKKGTALALKGKLAWMTPMKGQKNAYFGGVEFVDVNESDRRILKEFIENDIGPKP